MRYSIRDLGLLCSVIVSLSGCEAEVGAGDSTVSSTEALAASSNLYFRCNATGWDVNSATRLQASATTPGKYELWYEVKDAYMVEHGGDSCVFTETSTMNGWGDWQHSFASAYPVAISYRGTIDGWAPPSTNEFKVVYPALGKYRVTVTPTPRGTSHAGLYFTITPDNPATPITAPLFFSHPLESFAHPFALEFSSPNHPNHLSLSVRQGLPLLDVEHYGIKLYLDTTYGSVKHNIEFDVETGVIYQAATGNGPTTAVKLLPPSQGGDQPKYLSALQDLRFYSAFIVAGHVDVPLNYPPQPAFQSAVDYLDAVISDLRN